MKTIMYQQIQDQAAELAGRPKEKLPTSEFMILLMQFHTELQVMWNSQPWPELIMMNSYTPATLNGIVFIGMQEASANEIGDVLWAGTANPLVLQGPRPHRLGFIRRDNQIDFVTPVGYGAIPSTVWLEYQLPPSNLLAVYANPATAQPIIGYQGGVQSLATLNLPARFYQPLAALGAATLLTIDGLMAQSSALKNMAQANLDWQSQQPGMEAPWWRGIQIKR